MLCDWVKGLLIGEFVDLGAVLYSIIGESSPIIVDEEYYLLY
jgi:hypothetical protein